MKDVITTKYAPKVSDQYIIGIGASAGGLEAIYKLFNSKPPKNVSFVIIQHLPPDYKSSTSELLARKSGQKVVEVENNMHVEAGTIYVMSEKKNLTLKNGILFLRDSLVPYNNLIDSFFCSLAEDQGSKSIGIVLSGSNEDGTNGTEAIKAAGGHVIVQDPDTTDFGNMPASVITSGYADGIVAPELIMDTITNYLSQKILFSHFTENNEAGLLDIINLIKEHSPLDFTDYKRTTLIRRIMKRMAADNYNSLAQYIQFLKENPSEITALSKEFLISVTTFFRDSEAFDLLKEKALPEIIKNKSPEESLKVWSIGCATGEEAYSLAIIIDECLKEEKDVIDVKIFASDIDKEALAIASKGIYPKSIEKDISPERLKKYFVEENDKYKVKESLRQMIIFAQHDISKHPPYYKLDIITCRNLLIYLNPFLQKRILTTLHFCLNNNGFMLLGPSESLGNVKDNFIEISKQWKIYKNIKPTSFLENTNYTPQTYYKYSSKALPVVKPERNELQNHLFEAISIEFLNELKYAGVCIDEDFKIVKTLGEYKKYLIPEMFNFDLLELLPRELSIATASSLKKAISENREVSVKQVTFPDNKKTRSVDIMVKILPETKNSGKLLLVLFKEGKNKKKDTKKHEEVFDEGLFAQRYLTDLESDLKETKKKLEKAEDDLALSIDNARAYNEELISNNEELQSTNEEIQSINEELQTVNNDNQQKMKQLNELNDELNNYFRSTTNSQLYVDKDLIIRKFTPTAFKQINLKETDIGRPLNDISSNIRFSTLIADIKNCIATSTEIEHEVQTLNNKWYQMSVTPYLQYEHNKIDGVIITFNDITELKKNQDILNRIIQDHDTFINSVSHDLKNEVGKLLISSEQIYKNIEEMNMDEVRKIGAVVHRSARGLMNIMLDLTDISLIEKTISEDHYKNVNVKNLLKEIIVSFKDQVKESKAIIKTDFKVENIRFMKKNLRSVVSNLLSNAIKYRSPERRLEITICTEELEDYNILSIKDNGIGIPENKLKDVFAKYKRIHGASSPNIEGVGIGMYLTKKIIEAAKGKIEVTSTPGVGTTFTVWFLK